MRAWGGLRGRGAEPPQSRPEADDRPARDPDTVEQDPVCPECGQPVYRHAPPRARRRGLRLARRLAGTVAALAVLGILGFAGLLLVTPSAGNAQQLARAQDQAHHVPFPGPAVPPRFTAALVATEDHRFYSEPGIDPYAVVRAARSYLTGHGDTGGATLYQQLAKLLYTSGRSGPSAEAEQVALAVKLYQHYSRQQILQMYADVAYFGNGYYGLPAASCGYFGVQPAGLSWPQAAVLAGLVQAPSAYDPLTSPAQARAREEHVVGRLVATRTLSGAQAGQALSVPMSSLLASTRGCPG